MKSKTNLDINHKSDVYGDIVKFKDQPDPLEKDGNMQALMRILNGAIRSEEFVPLTVIGKNGVLKYDGVESISIDSKISKGEQKFLETAFEIGLKHYGDPVFDYFEVSENRYEDVDFGRNYVKMGRETGPRVKERRLEMLNKYFDKDRDLAEPKLDQTIEKNFISGYKQNQVGGKIVALDKHTMNLPFSVEGKNTNVGDPWFVRKNTKVSGVPALDLAKRESYKMDLDSMTYLSSFLGARSQRGKQAVQGCDIEEFYSKKGPKDFSAISFDNGKARVILAGPAIFTGKISPLLASLINERKEARYTNQVHLLGPEGIKNNLIKLKKFLRGKEYYPYNADATSYDTTLRAQHANGLYNIMDDKFYPKDRILFKHGLVSLFTRPLLYTENFSRDLSELKKNLIRRPRRQALGSGEPLTNYVGSEIMNFGTNYAQYKLNGNGTRLMHEAQSQGVNLTFTNGDDNLTIYMVKGGNILDHLHAHTEVMEKEFGLRFQEPSKKGELGYFYGQYRLTHDDRFITPLSRMRIFWKEDNGSSLPPYHYAVTIMQALEYRGECKGVKDGVKLLIAPFDKYKIGTTSEEGKRITFKTFRNKLREEAIKYDKTSKQMIFKGNPKDEADVFTDDGSIEDDGLRAQGDKVVSCLYDSDDA